MTTYYEIGEVDGKKRKSKFWESDAIVKKNVTRKIGEWTDKKDAYETLRKRAARTLLGIR